MDDRTYPIALIGVVPAACDAEAGEAQGHSQAATSFRCFQQEEFLAVDHDAATAGIPTSKKETRT